MRELTGRSALVTGASRGLGRHIARALAGEGMHLALTARSEEDLRKLASDLRTGGTAAAVIPADLTDRDAVEALAHRAEEELDGVDVLVNNAGVMETGPYHRRESDTVARAVELNLLAPMLLSRTLLGRMLERGRGHVVNLASLAGKAGPPFEAVYGATKAGLIGFTQSLRREYHGTGVSASAICPGYVTGAGMYADAVADTGAEAPGRVGRASPDEVAEAVIRSVEDDEPEVIVNSTPVRPLVVLSEASPRLGEWLGRRLGLFEAFERGAEHERQRERQEEGSG